MAHAIDGTIGADLTAVTAGTTTDGENALFALGSTVDATDGQEYVYVQAGGAITQYDTVAIDENYQAVPITKALADAGHQVGFAQIAFADNDLGWVPLGGTNIQTRLAASCEPDVQLYTTGTAGVLDDTAASQTLIRGVVGVTTASSGISPVEVIARGVSATATP